MEKNNKKQNKSFGHNSIQTIFLLSNYLEEPKDKKNWFTGQFEKYMTTIKNDVDNITKEERFERLRKKIHLNSFSQNKKYYLDKVKFNHMLPLSKGNKFYLKKNNSKKVLNNLTNNSEDNSLTINVDNHYEYKNIKINNSEQNTIKEDIKEDTKDNSNENNKYNIKLDLNTLPNIPLIENKNKYITKYINNISEKTDNLEKKLIKQEKMKYLSFKSKYNRLFNNYKKVQVDIDQYVNPKKDKKYKFNLNEVSDQINSEKMGNLKRVIRQISNKIKNRQQNKPSISDIINEVENFKYKEKRLRERIKKSHDKFDYLINDSNIIQKRIDIKCQKNNIEI